MRRKLLWTAIVVVLVFVGFGVADHREAKRRQELWAEATDDL